KCYFYGFLGCLDYYFETFKNENFLLPFQKNIDDWRKNLELFFRYRIEKEDKNYKRKMIADAFKILEASNTI
ncbi:hypothetical protein GVAV_003204, partial [Gurleya vavrai]